MKGKPSIVIDDLVKYTDKGDEWKSEYIQHPYYPGFFQKQLEGLKGSVPKYLRAFYNRDPKQLWFKVEPEEDNWTYSEKSVLVSLKEIKEPENLNLPQNIDKITSWILGNLVLAHETNDILFPLLNTYTKVVDIKQFIKTVKSDKLKDKLVDLIKGKDNDEWISVQIYDQRYPTIYLSSLLRKKQSKIFFEQVTKQVLTTINLIKTYYPKFSHGNFKPEMLMVARLPNGKYQIRLSHFDNASMTRPGSDYKKFLASVLNTEDYMIPSSMRTVYTMFLTDPLYTPLFALDYINLLYRDSLIVSVLHAEDVYGRAKGKKELKEAKEKLDELKPELKKAKEDFDKADKKQQDELEKVKKANKEADEEDGEGDGEGDGKGDGEGDGKGDGDGDGDGDAGDAGDAGDKKKASDKTSKAKKAEKDSKTKTAEKMEKDAAKAEKDAQKEADKAQKEADKAQKAVEKADREAREQADKEAEKARKAVEKKAEREEKEAEKEAEKGLIQ